MAAKKWQENEFWQNIADDCIPCESKISTKWLILHRFQDKCVFAFYADIQYGRQKWWENKFWQKEADNSTHDLWG